MSVTQRALRDLQNAKKSLRSRLYDQAVEAADKAVETVLRGWLEQKGVTRSAQPKEQPSLIKDVKKMGYTVPFENDLKTVRRLRNRIRHLGYAGGQQEAKAAVDIVEKFIDEVRRLETKTEAKVPKTKRVQRARLLSVKKPRSAPAATKPEKPASEIRTTRLRSPFDDIVVGGVTLVVGMILNWILIFGMVVPSVLQSVPSDIWTFLSQFIMFLVATTLGLYLSKLGATRMNEPKTAKGVLTYSGVFMLVVVVIVMVMRWGGGFQAADLTFWYRMAYAFGLIGMGVYSINAGRKITGRRA